MLIVPGLHLGQNACMSLGLGRIQCRGGQVMDGITLDHMLQLDLYPMCKVPNFVWGTHHMLKLCVKLVVI